jgi:hypothetical protein
LDYFLKHGANINLTDSEGWNLLLYTSAYESIEMAKFLIENKINVNAKSKRMNTALIFAIRGYFYVSAELLLDNGADSTIISIDHGDALKVCETYIPTNAVSKVQHEKLFKRLELIKAKLPLANSPKPIDDSKMCTCINYKGREIQFPDDPLIEMFWDKESGIKSESAKYTLCDFGGTTKRFKRVENGKWVDSEFAFPKCQIQYPYTMKIKCHVLPAGLYAETETLVRFNDFTTY